MDRAGWMALLGLQEHEVPRLLVLEGTWWRQKALDARLPHLTGVRELGMPDLWHGWVGDVPVAYCPAYGAPRAVEPVHVLGTVGQPTVVQIGTCGGLQPHLRTGDVVVPTWAAVGEGASRYYSDETLVASDPEVSGSAQAVLLSAGITVERGTAVSTSALLQQPPELVARWSAEGHAGVDMETSAVLTVAKHFRLRAASLLVVWDVLPGRSWTDPLTEQEQTALHRSNAAVFEAALAQRHGYPDRACHRRGNDGWDLPQPPTVGYVLLRGSPVSLHRCEHCGAWSWTDPFDRKGWMVISDDEARALQADPSFKPA